MFDDAVGGVKAGNSRRHHEGERDGKLHPHGPGEQDEELRKAEHEARADKSDKDAARQARAGLIGSHPCRYAAEHRQGIDGKREQQPAEDCNCGDGSENCYYHGGVSVR